MGHRHRRKRSNSWIWIVLFLCSILFLILGICSEKSRHTQARGTEMSNVGMRTRIQYDNQSYIQKSGVTTILLMGTDQGESPAQYGARKGGQADFQMLVIIDPNTKSIYRLQIDRDTIAEVEALGVLGNSLGLQPMQICLAHAFGTTPEECSARAVDAVERLFPYLDIDFALTFDLSAIGLLNDALGGVTVTLAEDFTAYDPDMVPGATLTLNARQSEIFVRNRMEVGDGSNSARMLRQQTYMSAAAQILKQKLKENTDFADFLFETLGDSLFSDAPRSRLINEINRAYSFRLLPADTLPGTHSIGKDGFVEFHPDDEAPIHWILQVLFEPAE